MMDNRALIGIILSIIVFAFSFYFLTKPYQRLSLNLVITISLNYSLSAGILSFFVASKFFIQKKITIIEILIGILTIGLLINAMTFGVTEISRLENCGENAVTMLISSSVCAMYAFGFLNGYIKK